MVFPRLGCGAAGGTFPPTTGALNPPRRLHLPGSLFGTLQACTLPSYATAATRETGWERGICKFANSSLQNLALDPAILAHVRSDSPAKSYTNRSIFPRDSIDYFNERGIPCVQKDPRLNGRIER